MPRPSKFSPAARRQQARSHNNNLPGLDEPPHDPDSERRVLAAVLIDPQALSAANLATADFFDPAHAAVWDAMQALAAEGATPDAALVLDRLKRLPPDRSNVLDKPPAALLAEIAQAECTAANIRFYADIVREKADVRRKQATALATLAAIQRGESAGTPANGTTIIAAYEPVLVNLATVTPRQVQWLWPNRIPLGKLTLVAGEPGLGKSFLTMDLAARVTRGSAWTDAPGTYAPLGSVVLLSAEDDIEDTIRPRLDAAGADVSKIVALQGVEFRNKELGKPITRTFNLEQDLPALEIALAGLKDCRLVCIDPITAYVGGKDSHKHADIRGMLAPLAELAGRYGVAIVAVTHLNKCSGQKAMHRFTGSLAFVAAARAGWLVAADKENPKRRLFLPVKNNLAEETSGLAYGIIDGVVAWERGAVTMTADDAIGDDPKKDGHTERDDASDWLRDLLADGPLTGVEVKQAAKEIGHAWATVRRAQKRLGIQPRKEGFGKGAKWFWELPAGTKVLRDDEDAQPPDVSNFDGGEQLREPDAIDSGELPPDGDWGEV